MNPATPFGSQRPAALLLDMDGTLVDTERLWLEAERAAAARFGGSVPDSAEAELLGLDTDTMLDLLSSRYGARADRARLRDAVMHEVGERLSGARACPGAADFVAAARAAGIRCALVSNSPASIVQATLQAQPWAGALEVRVSADDAERAKPAPDLYLTALRRLRLAPSECLAVEDSPTGARAAVDAGLVCLGVAASVEQADSLRAVTPHVLPSLSHARHWLGLHEARWPHDTEAEANGNRGTR